MPSEYTIWLIWSSTLNVPVLSSSGWGSIIRWALSLPPSFAEAKIFSSTPGWVAVLLSGFQICQRTLLWLPLDPSDGYWWGCSLDWESAPILSLSLSLFQFIPIKTIEVLRWSCEVGLCDLYSAPQHNHSVLALLLSFTSSTPPLHQHFGFQHPEN